MYFALLTFVVYSLQLTKDIYSGDIGDLVTSACVGGVAHPPGYPLFMLLGHFLCSIPSPLSPVTRVAFISAVAASLGVYLLYRFSYLVTRSRYLSVLSSSLLAFSYLFWLHAELPEVFGLHNFFVILLFYLAYDYHEKPSPAKLYRLAAVTGIALTHHQTILFLGPALTIFVLSKWKILWEKKLLVLYAVGFALAGFLLPYIYVFIAAAKDPVVNWDSVTDLRTLIHLILRKSYGGFAPSVENGIPIAVKSAVIRDYFKTIVANYSYQGILLGVLGLIEIFRRKRWAVGAAFLTAFLLTGPLFVAYAATYYTTATAFGIIERFYNTSFVIFAFLFPFGFVLLNDVLKRYFKKPQLRVALLSYFLIIPVFMIIYNHPKTDLSKTQIGTILAYDILDSLPENAVIFISGDTTTFNIWYAYFVLHRRPDVGIINPPGVGNNVFLNDELTKFHQKNKDRKLSELMGATLDNLYMRRPMFATYDIPTKPAGTILLPRGLIYQVIRREEIPTKEEYIKMVTSDVRKMHKTRRETLSLAEQNLVAEEIPLIYGNAYVRIADFLDAHYKDPQSAEQFYRLGLWRDDLNSGAYAGLALVQFKAYNDCASALSNINRAIELYPVWNTFYVQRYILSVRCKTPQAKLSEYKKDYLARFRKNIDEVIKTRYHLEL